MSEHAGLYIIFGGMILFVLAVVVYDQLAGRNKRRERERHHSA